MGDSFTEGTCDRPRPDGFPIGWSDRVANALAQHERRRGGTLSYANLAVRGKLLDQVVSEQLPVAATMQPTLATFHAGPNDVLRRGTDFEDLQTRYEAAVRDVAAISDHIVLFTAIGRAGGTGRLAQLLADRFARFNDGVRAVAASVGATVVDLEPVEALSDRRLWDEDRLHLNESGHRHVTAAVLEALGYADPVLLDGPVGWWRVALPPAPPSSVAQDLAADVTWVRTHLLPWVGRRLRGRSSGDGRTPKDPVLRELT